MKKFCILMFMAFGVLVLVMPASATPIITHLDGNPKIEDLCPNCSLYDDKIDPVPDGTNTFGPLTITVYDTAAGQVFDWTSTSYISMILVKGRPDSILYDYGCPGEASDTGLHAPMNPSGKWAGLSHISYCAGSPVPEPATMLLFSAGLAGLGVFRKKFKKA